jgi:hypothetical protein
MNDLKNNSEIKPLSLLQWNVNELLPDYTASQPQRQYSTQSPLWKP